MICCNRKAYTLIELLIVIAILSIAGATFYRSHQESARIHADNVFREKALWTLSSQEAFVRVAPYDSLLAGTRKFDAAVIRESGLFRASGNLLIEDARPSLKKITISLNYEDAAMTSRNLSVVAYRSRY